MDLTPIRVFLPLTAATAYTLLLLWMLAGKPRQQLAQTRWFSGFLAASAAGELLLLFVIPGQAQMAFSLTGFVGGTILLALTTNSYVEWPQQQRLLAVATALLGVALLVDLIYPSSRVIGPFLFSLGALLALLAWSIVNAAILLKSWRTYRATRLPWHGNRLLHWFVFVMVAAVGELLLFRNQGAWSVVGQIVRFMGVIGLARAVTSYRLFDVRARLGRWLTFALITLLSSLPATLMLLAGLWASDRLAPEGTYTYLFTAVIIAASFVLYQPFRSWIERVVYRYLLGEGLQTGQIVRRYSHATSRTLDVEQLALVIINTLADLLKTSRGALLLVTDDEQGYEVEPVPVMGSFSRERKRFAPGSLFIRGLTNRHQPLLQYDIDFSPTLVEMEETDRKWLAEQGMDLYVPVQAGGELTGIIALGPKQSGLAYQPDELELVQVLADQTVVALQNARLYSELNHQNDRVRHLNIDLQQQNRRLATLDKVKSDFITIASHELRTPLTQVKGYADILQAMNEENGLTREQTREIVGHITRASSRLEELISAMLDASQLEASGMNMTYMQTRIDTIIRLAAEPLAEALKLRGLRLETKSIGDLPSHYADYKRLVQAFNNILGNAIKYTPDQGTITVTAEQIQSANGAGEFIEVVVSDGGIGIEPEYHELIFEKFFRVGDPQLHSTGSTKFKGAGPGLGLYIARGVIEAHGGRIWVESEGEDEERLPGSCFHIVLPVKPPDYDEQVAATAAGKEKQPASLTG